MVVAVIQSNNKKNYQNLLSKQKLNANCDIIKKKTKSQFSKIESITHINRNEIEIIIVKVNDPLSTAGRQVTFVYIYFYYVII